MIEHPDCAEYEELIARWDAGDRPEPSDCPVCRARARVVDELLGYLIAVRVAFTD